MDTKTLVRHLTAADHRDHWDDMQDGEPEWLLVGYLTCRVRKSQIRELRRTRSLFSIVLPLISCSKRWVKTPCCVMWEGFPKIVDSLNPMMDLQTLNERSLTAVKRRKQWFLLCVHMDWWVQWTALIALRSMQMDAAGATCNSKMNMNDD